MKGVIRNLDTGWFNLELTTGTKPSDDWLTSSGFINAAAIKYGVYMTPLYDQETIALCMINLVDGYRLKGELDFDFVQDSRFRLYPPVNLFDLKCFLKISAVILLL